MDSATHSNNFNGNLTTPSKARTAAQSGPLEIAASASIRHREAGPFQNYSDVFGDAMFEWDVLVLNEGDVSFTFNLPPGFVEIQSNAEFQSQLDLTAAVQANIQYCSPAGTYSPANNSLFQMFSSLEGNFQTYQLFNGASSVNPGLDTYPLTHQNVVLTDGGFIRTCIPDMGGRRRSTIRSSFPRTRCPSRAWSRSTSCPRKGYRNQYRAV